MKRSPIPAYRREVAEAERWLKDHERNCDICDEREEHDSGRCEKGQMMARYLHNNQKILKRLVEDEAEAGSAQCTLFEFPGHVPA